MGPNSILDKGARFTTACEEYRFVTLTDTMTVKRADAAGQRAIGVNQYPVDAEMAAANAHGDVRILGISFVEVSEAIAQDDWVTTTNDGRAAVADAGQEILGRCLVGVDTAGDITAVLLTPGPGSVPSGG